MIEVFGVVEAVGTKFNGSLKVHEIWYSFVKGYSGPKALKGNTVKLTLEEWKSGDKKGFNIVDCIVDPVTPPSTQETVQTNTNDEARGKVRHGLTVALVPLVAQEMLTVDKLKEIVNSVVEFVMTGK